MARRASLRLLLLSAYLSWRGLVYPPSFPPSAPPPWLSPLSASPSTLVLPSCLRLTHVPPHQLPGRGLVEDVEPDSFSAALAAGELVASPIDLGLGDLYFFKSDAVHQVPWFAGRCARPLCRLLFQSVARSVHACCRPRTSPGESLGSSSESSESSSHLSAGLGRRARVVLGAFVGYSEGDPFIDVWG